jgi:hypothetical protein
MPTNLDNAENDFIDKVFPNGLVYYKKLGPRHQNDYQFCDNFKLWTVDNDFFSLASYEKKTKQKYAQIINGSFFNRVHLSLSKKNNILVFDYDKANFGIL